MAPVTITTSLSAETIMPKSISAPRVLLALIALHACTTGDIQFGDVGPGGPGRLVIIGGALQADNAIVYQAVVEARAGGGPLCVVPTASSDPAESMAGAVQRLAEYAGVGSVKGILISTEDPARAQDPSVVAELAACSGFYFTGGSQSRIVDVFLPAGDTTEAYRAVKQRWQEGAVVAGSSAGAAMMSRVMISGGSSAEAVSYGVADDQDADGVQIRQGMGFFEPLLDQHFLARGRIGRLLISVIQTDLPQVGLGIDENTALIVDGDSAVVVGASGVIVVDGRTASRTAAHRASELTVNLAGAGDVIDLRTLEIRVPSDKRAVPIVDQSVELPEDPFARWAFLHLVAGLARSSAREATFDLSDATLRVVKDAGFSASMVESTGGVEMTPMGLSAGPFRVDLLPSGS